MNGVIITNLNCISKQENGGTYRIKLWQQGEGLFVTRKAGITFGKHYHKGASKTKSPERIFLISGLLDLECRDVRTGTTETYRLEGPSEVSIDAFIWHKLESITDLTFIEFNSLEEHVADTYYDFDPETNQVREAE